MRGGVRRDREGREGAMHIVEKLLLGSQARIHVKIHGYTHTNKRTNV